MRKFVLILGLITALNANAACDEEGYFDCGTTGEVRWYLSSDKTTLTFSGHGKTADDYYEEANPYYDGVTDFANKRTSAPWGQYNNTVTNIEVKPGVTSVSWVALGFVHVTDVSLPDTLKTIGEGAFNRTYSLLNINFPQSLTTIGEGSFWRTGVSNIIIPDSVTSVEGASFRAPAIETLFVPDSVVSIGKGAFGDLTATVYCPSAELCAEKGSDNIQVYSKDENGVYEVGDMYFSSPENMLSNTTCNNTDGTCAAEAAAYKAQKAQSMAGGTLCATPEDCLKLMDMASIGTNCTTIASCHAYLNRQETNPDGSLSIYKDGQFVGYKNKRIYTIDEANAVAGTTNHVKIRYR